MQRFVFVFALGLAGLALGCGRDTPGDSFEQIQEKNENRLKGIAEDKTLSDADAIEKYIKNFQYALPADISPAMTVKPVEGGFQLVSRGLKTSPLAKYTPEEKLQGGRNLIKLKLDEAKRMLGHLKGRSVSSVSVTLFTKVTGQDGHVPIFQAVLTQADLAKLGDATVAADAGSYYDPRGTKISEVWKVELNRFPDIEYTAPGGK